MDQLISVGEAADFVGVHRSTLRRWSADGIAPKPVRLGPFRIFYRRPDIEKFITGAPEVSE